MPDNRVQGIVGGFGAGSRAGIASRSLDVQEEQAKVQQRNQLRKEGDASVEDSLGKLESAAKTNSINAFSPDGNREEAIRVQTETAKALWESTRQMLEMGKKHGLYNDAEIANIKARFRVGASLNNPAAEQRLEEAEKTRGAVNTATGKQPLKIEEIREKGRQDQITKGIASTQNINSVTDNINDRRMGDAVSARAELKDYDRVNRQLRKAQDAFDSWRAAKGSGGISGAVGENIGGLLGQIPLMGEGLENGLNLMVTGGTTEQNTRARTNAITLAADMLSEITGEESGRFTEAERELAFRALRQLSASASVTQIAEAYRVFIETSVNEKSRKLGNLKLPSRFDIDESGKLTVDGHTDYVMHLKRRGFTEVQAIQALKRRIRNEELEGAN